MKQCIFCNTSLQNTNNSKEHIIPNALGGMLKSKDVLCKDCNSSLSRNIDNKLYEFFKFVDCMLGIKKDRKNKSTYLPATMCGEDVKIYADFNVYSDPKIAENIYKGHKYTKITSSQTFPKDDKEAKKRLEKMIKKFINAKYGEKVEYKTQYGFIPNDKPKLFIQSLEQDFKSLFFGYFKIILCFCVFCDKTNVLDDEVLKIKEEIIKACSCDKFNMQRNAILEELEKITFVFNQELDFNKQILFLKCDSKAKKVYGIVSLFGIAIVFILNNNYQGDDFSKIYIYDIKKSKVVENDGILNICATLDLGYVEPLIFLLNNKEQILKILKKVIAKHFYTLSLKEFKNIMLEEIRQVYGNNKDFKKLKNEKLLEIIEFKIYPIYQTFLQVKENFANQISDMFDMQNEQMARVIHGFIINYVLAY